MEKLSCLVSLKKFGWENKNGLSSSMKLEGIVLTCKASLHAKRGQTHRQHPRIPQGSIYYFQKKLQFCRWDGGFGVPLRV